jgi:hypothetical protein
MKTNISKIKNLLENLGKCEIDFNYTSLDFTFNKVIPSSISDTFFKDIKEEFYALIKLQLSYAKIDKELIDELLIIINQNLTSIEVVKNNHRVAFLRIKEKSAVSHNTHLLINKIVDIQKNVLYELRSCLRELSQGLNYIIEDDIKQLKDANVHPQDDVIPSPELGKLVFKLNKKDTANFITLLEYLEIIDFNGTSRNQFIETNFQYWSKSNMPVDISKINSDIANLHDTSGDFGKRNSKSMSLLVKNLLNKFKQVEYNDYAEWLKSKV